MLHNLLKIEDFFYKSKLLRLYYQTHIKHFSSHPRGIATPFFLIKMIAVFIDGGLICHGDAHILCMDVDHLLASLTLQ